MKATKTPWCKYDDDSWGYRSQLVWLCRGQIHELFDFPTLPKAIRLVLCKRPSKWTQTVELREHYGYLVAFLPDGEEIGLSVCTEDFLRRAGLANKTVHFCCEWR